MQAIYKPKGRAAEYFKLACNPFKGCVHGCKYCYVPGMLRVSKEEFHAESKAKPGFAEQFEKDCKKFANSPDHCLLSFSHDMFQNVYIKGEVNMSYAKNGAKIAKGIIEQLHASNIPVAFLTKGIILFEVMDKLKSTDTVGVTLTFVDPLKSREWEPYAALPDDRISNLVAAKVRGIPTFVSIEPVIDPVESLAVMRKAAPYTDKFLVGTANYIGSTVDWVKFYADVMALFSELGITNYYIKESLRKAAGVPAPEEKPVQWAEKDIEAQRMLLL